MIIGKPQPERELFETGGEPSYHISEIKIEITDDGSVLVYAYQLRHGTQLHLQFIASVSAAHLAVMARQALQASADAHNQQLFDDPTTAH